MLPGGFALTGCAVLETTPCRSKHADVWGANSFGRGQSWDVTVVSTTCKQEGPFPELSQRLGTGKRQMPSAEVWNAARPSDRRRTQEPKDAAAVPPAWGWYPRATKAAPHPNPAPPLHRPSAGAIQGEKGNKSKVPALPRHTVPALS